MQSPLKNNPRVSQVFGVNKEIYKRWGLSGHNGTDFSIPNGTKVYAPHGGKVTELAFDKNGYGRYVKIENSKWGSVLAHLRSYNVVLGQVVKQGALLGLSNDTGFSTGPHLHWGLHPFPRDRKNGCGGYINPLELLGGEDMTEAEVIKIIQKVMNVGDEYGKDTPADVQRTCEWVKSLREDFNKLEEKLEEGGDEVEEIPQSETGFILARCISSILKQLFPARFK